MLKKTIKYEDFMGNEREETFYFNMTETELALLTKTHGDISELLTKASNDDDAAAVVEIISDIVLSSYGIPSADGRRFEKTIENRTEFEQSAAFQELIVNILTDEKAAESFVLGIIPKKYRETANKELEKMK